MPANTKFSADLCEYAQLWSDLKEEMAVTTDEAIDEAVYALADMGISSLSIFELIAALVGSRRAIEIWSDRRNSLGNPLWYRQFGSDDSDVYGKPWLSWGAAQ